MTEIDIQFFFLESSIVPHTAFNPTDCLPNGLTGPGDPYSDFGQSSNSDLSNFRSSNHSGDHQFNQSAFGMNDDSMVHQLIPTPHNTIDENDEYFTVSGPIFLTVSSNLTDNIIFIQFEKMRGRFSLRITLNLTILIKIDIWT